MQIKDVAQSKKIPLLKAKIVEMGEIRDAGENQIQEAFIEDDSGKVKLTLWNEQVNIYKVGDEIVIRDGWCKEFKDELQVSSGKFGSIRKVEK